MSGLAYTLPMFSSLLFALIVFLISFFGPGFFLTRKWSGSPEERIAAGVAVSLLLVYLLSFAVFLLGLPPAAHEVILVLCLGLTLAGVRDLGKLFESRDARAAFGWFSLLLLWCAALTALIRNYSGGTWYGDWLEHYQRSLFFLGGMPSDFIFQGSYLLPARPPLMNLLCAHFMALAGRDFAVYQLASVLLSCLIFFPVLLLARLFSPRGRVAVAAVTAILMFNPMAVQNATYAWTKLLAAFYVLLGIDLYLTALPARDRTRLLLAFACLAAGTLTHYSAAPYFLFFAIHLAFLVRRRDPGRGREAAFAGLLSGLILATWLAWSLGTYGARATVASTSTVRDTAALSGAGNAGKIAGNLWSTLVPHPLRLVDLEVFRRGPTRGALRDVFFKMYQQDLLLAFGLAGLPLLLMALLRSRREAAGRRLPGRSFWLGFSLFIVIVGIAVHGGEDPVGLAHICLQPLVLLGLAFLASRWETWPRGLRLAMAAGFLADFLLGIGLHFWFQATPFVLPARSEGFWSLARRDLLVGSCKANWDLKTAGPYLFLGDLLAPWIPLLLAALAIPVLCAGARLALPPAAERRR
jgi:hypothetical protein